MRTWQKEERNLFESLRLELEILEDRYMLSTVQIFAAGETGEEQLELQIDGVSAQVWNNVGGDAEQRVFQEFSYSTPANLSPEQIRVSFSNDAFLANGGDRNLRVDRIQLDGVTYEMEDPSVLSTGTWRSLDGCEPGFKESEYLHCDGYFQLASLSSNDAPIITDGPDTTTLTTSGTGLTDSGTLTISDANTTNLVTAAVDSVVVNGTSVSSIPGSLTNVILRGFMSVTPTAILDATETSDTLTWNFNSGSEAFDFLDNGETLILTYTISATDDDVTPLSDTETVAITINSGSVGSGSNVTINAAGATGEESMALQIDGNTVKTWNNVGGDYDQGDFESFTFSSGVALTAGQIRVAFTNDGLSTGGEDRNLRIDNILVDGVVFETEDPTVVSTGTWTQSDGCEPGNKQSEELHCGGYFQFADATGSGAEIKVFAAGATGEETLQLQINGSTVKSWQNIGGDYINGVFQEFVYNTGATVTADDIRLFFSNDGVSATGADRNVRIDKISIDGLGFESEANTIYSTGTWTSVDGCEPGFKQSEYLHCDGYLQFASAPPANPGTIGLSTNSYVVNEADGFVDVVIERNSGTDGLITVDYRTFAGTAIDGEDFNGVSGRAAMANGIDSATISIPILQNTLSEPNETFTFTIDNVQGGAVLLTPRTATIAITDDELPPGLGGFEVEFVDFSDVSTLTLNGNATQLSDRLRLTTNTANQRGSAYYSEAIKFDTDTSIQTHFQFKLTGGTTEGDGLTFILQNSAEGATALGGSGGVLGYDNIGTASIAVEFDTIQDAWDIDDNHISILRDGDTQTAIVSQSPAIDLNGGEMVYAWVDYDGPTNILQVFVSATDVKPATAEVTTQIDLFVELGSKAYFGFSAATSSQANLHDLYQWQFASSAQLVPPPVSFTGQTIFSGLDSPTAIDWSPDAANMYIAEKGGIVWVAQGSTLLSVPFIDLSEEVNENSDRGLLDIAIHPDFVNHPYVYLLYTYDPPETQGFTGLAGPDRMGNRAGRLLRVEADAATNYTTAVAGSEVVLLGANGTWDNFNGFVNSTVDFSEPPAGILPNGENLQDFLAADSTSHSIGTIEFGIDGALYVSNGDGASYNQVDPRAVRVQDIDNLSGKVLRIDPLTGAGLSGNPFYEAEDPNSNRSKVYQYGMRNPFRITVHPVTGQVFVGDVGWSAWEEINAGVPGDNFGWPYYEGGSGTSEQTGGYQNLQQAQDFYASGESVTSSIFALSHSVDGINAIIAGDVYTGDVYPSEYQGDLFFNDLGQGILRNANFDGAGNFISYETFATDAQYVVQIVEGPDGYLYYVNLTGSVGRWEVTATAAETLPGGASGASAGLDPVDSMNDPRAKLSLTDNQLSFVPPEAINEVIVNLETRQIQLNQGIWYSLAEGVDEIFIRGKAASDNTFLVIGTNGNDTARMRNGRLVMTGPGYRLVATHADAIDVWAGEGEKDTAKLYDTPGNDQLTSTDGTVLLSSEITTYAAHGFDRAQVYATQGGTDNAVLVDSLGQDTFTARPEWSRFTNPEYNYLIKGFDEVVAQSTHGGNDRALMYDSTGDDLYEAWSHLVVMSSTWFRNAAEGFSSVTGFAPLEGTDKAVFHDSSASDVFVSNPTLARMYADSYNNKAKRFDQVEASSGGSGLDKAIFYDSTGSDLFVIRVDSVEYLSGSTSVKAIGFQQTSSNSRAGGNDVVEFQYDPAEATLTDLNDVLRLTSSLATHRAVEMEEIRIVLLSDQV